MKTYRVLATVRQLEMFELEANSKEDAKRRWKAGDGELVGESWRGYGGVTVVLAPRVTVTKREKA